MPPSESALFALTLESLPGVGRVTAGRILSLFHSYDQVLTYPYEQVLLRLKGAPNADVLVSRLFDERGMREAFDKTRTQLEHLAARQVAVVAPGDADWPQRLADLPRAHRPNVLYTYGSTALLTQPSVAFLSQTPISEAAFEQAQALARHLMTYKHPVMAGMANGFDLVLHKISATSPTPRPSIIVYHSGLARLERQYRSIVGSAVKNGSVFLSSFPLTHGPFSHDDRERALIQAALARASVFFEPVPDTPEWEALHWALEADRPVFGVPHSDQPLPERVHLLQTEVDFDWVVAAVQEVGS